MGTFSAFSLLRTTQRPPSQRSGVTLASLEHVELPAGRDSDVLPLAGSITREVIRSAMDVLVRRYGLIDRAAAFAVLESIARIGQVKLRLLAAHVVIHDGGQFGSAAPLHLVIPAQPPITFGRPGWAAHLRRISVLAELMSVAGNVADAPRATIQAVEPVSGGLLIEKHAGFPREFLDYFSYLRSPETPSGTALANAKQVVLPDVALGDGYDAGAQAMMLKHGARCVISTPLRDSANQVLGVVSSHHPIGDRVPDQETLDHIQDHADEAGRWLRWFESNVMPLMVHAVHCSAAQNR